MATLAVELLASTGLPGKFKKSANAVVYCIHTSLRQKKRNRLSPSWSWNARLAGLLQSGTRLIEKRLGASLSLFISVFSDGMAGFKDETWLGGALGVKGAESLLPKVVDDLLVLFPIMLCKLSSKFSIDADLREKRERGWLRASFFQIKAEKTYWVPPAILGSDKFAFD